MAFGYLGSIGSVFLFPEAHTDKIPGTLNFGADNRNKTKLVVAKSLGIGSCFWIYNQDPGQ